MKFYYNTPTGEYEYEPDIYEVEKAIAEVAAKEIVKDTKPTDYERTLIKLALQMFLTSTGVISYSAEFEDFFKDYYDDDLKAYFEDAAMEEYGADIDDTDPYEGMHI